MPSLFNRRSRSVSTSRPTTPASSSAHLAAAQAFLSNQSPQSKLSASAAAAALRSMSPPPTPVDQVQTKRMLSRQSSTSSTANATRGRTGGGLQRRPSGGSMTERTFRSPSPGKPGSQTDHLAGSGRGTTPPVPPVPQTYDNIPPIPPKSHRRSASVDAPPLLVTKSKQPTSAGRGQSVDRSAPVTSPAAAAARRSVSAQKQPPSEMQRSDSQDSRNSFNFSYPRGTRPSSPPPKSPLGTNGAMSSLPATTGLSASETRQIQNNLSQTAAKPVKKKKKKVDQSAAEGSHLHAGTMAAKPSITALEPQQQPSPQPQITQKAKKKAALSGQSTHFPEHQESSAGTDPGSDSDLAASPDMDKRAKRASGILMKHPSIVREDWEGEQQEEAGSSPVQAGTPTRTTSKPAAIVTQPALPKKSTPAANMSRKIGESSSTLKSGSSIAPNAPVHETVTVPSARASEANINLTPRSTDSSIGRGASISPSRSTRFSDRLASDLVAGRKHEPLGRSISPAKSALKHTALEASPTDPNFHQRRDASVTPSESSEMSASGLSRKKSARVSFETLPQVINPISDAEPSKETGKKGWFGLGKNKSPNSTNNATADDVEEGMKPRPALPSFGSVRRSERSVSPAVPEVAVSGTPQSAQTASSSETSSLADPPTMETSISSDHAVGGVLFREAHKGKEPLPPQVTSVEGTGYVSDTDSLSSDDDVPSFHAAQQASKQLGETIRDQKVGAKSKESIPVIAVQPATPGLEESELNEEWTAEVPGGFPSSATSEDSLPDIDQKATSPDKSTGLGIHRSVQEDAPNATEQDSPPTLAAHQLTTIAEEESDASSLYSDAAEDLSDLEGDGFGSINAIVESPVVVSPRGHVVSPPESPLGAINQTRPVDPERTASWEDTQAHWSGLAQRFRNSQSSVDQPTAAPVVAVKTGPVPQKKIKKKKPQNAAAPASVPPSVAPPSKPAQAATSRAQAATVVSTRTTAQPSPVSRTQGQLRNSMRGPPEPVVAPRQRPVSTVESPTATKTIAQKKTTPAVAPPRTLPRRFSEDSDSDSSFKRNRRRAKPTDGKYTMKRSMRAGPAEPEYPVIPAGRGTVRSMSPVDRRPLSPMGARTMRTSMRGSVDAGIPTLRGQQESKRSSSLFSRNRKANMSPTRPSSTLSTVTKLKSRIADSDDEDGPRATRFTSRFADSSDEDEPEKLRPVRGIPRRKDDGDSTDLDDSSDDQGRKSKSAAAQKKLTIVPPPPTEEIASPPLSPTTAKKRGLWGRLRGKKKDDVGADASQINLSPSETKTETKTEAETGKEKEKVSKNAKQLGFRSDAERDALVEQTRLRLEAAQDRPTSPPITKSNRRLAPHRVLSDSWAQPRMSVTVEDRPNTSGNMNGKARPEMGDRQESGVSLADGESGVQGKGGKKKKFALLRKAFGLND